MERPRLILSRGRTAAIAALLSVPIACGGGGSSGGTGGAGATATGGTTQSTGGATGAGGQPTTSTGGSPSTGTGGNGSGGVGAATGGQAGGAVSARGGNSGGPGQSGGDRGTGGAAGTAAGTGGSGGVPGTGALSPNPAGARQVITGVRGVSTAAATLGIDYLNGAGAPASITGVAFGAVEQVSTTFTPSTQDAHSTPLTPSAPLFQVAGPKTFPASVAAGGTFSVDAQLMPASAGLPAAPAQDSGATVLSAMLTVDTAAGPVQTPVYALVLTQALWEPTLGEILFTLGYKLNVGKAQNNSNPNRGGTPQQLPGVEAGTDEIAAPLFVKAGTGSVTLVPVARFSPMGPLPFGWYPSGAPTTRNVVGTMAQATDPQTSNKARMVQPPLAAGSNTTFDPGTQTFGIWVYTDEASQKYDTGTVAYGDYDYTQDALNSPANAHRFKVYPLKDSAGAAVADSFVLACEEAANGDYQDYVFVLRNAKVAP